MVPKFLQKKAEAGFKLLATEKNLAEKGEKRVSEAQKKGKNTVWPPKFESKTIVAEFGQRLERETREAILFLNTAELIRRGKFSGHKNAMQNWHGGKKNARPISEAEKSDEKKSRGKFARRKKILGRKIKGIFFLGGGSEEVSHLMCDFFCFQRVQPENWGHW